MCGISGIVSSSIDGLQQQIEGMVASTVHRGPDGRGTLVERVQEESAIALGHNRLSIVDLSDHAAQPMISGDGRYVLVYNGEVYNYKEIAAELDRADLPEGEFGDTAVVLAALAKWGPSALTRFNGMWALLLYDRREKTLLISRDRFGVKPLYYFNDGSSLYFASEVKAILNATQKTFRVNGRAAVPYLTRGLLNFSDETFFEEVRQFAPASYQIINTRRPGAFRHSPTKFWTHPFERGEEPAVGRVSPREIRDVFLDAIRLRLRSDVPVGVLLSGGVDSSSIVGGIAALRATEGICILSVTSDDPASNEEPFIDRMATFAGVTPVKVNVSTDPSMLLDRLSEAVWFNDEPLLGVSDIAYLRLMEAARAEGLKVLLSGQGADEQLGGYNKFFFFWLMNLVKDRRYVSAARTLLQSALTSNTLYEFRWAEAIRYFGRDRLLKNTFIAPAVQSLDTVQIGLDGSYAKREWIDLVKTSVPALLHYEDRMSMSRSVEVRVPFLDYRLVELLARVHPSEKFEGGWTKAIFRKAVEGLVPKEIQYRRDKKGFNVPEDHWMRNDFSSHARQIFGGPMLAERLGVIDGHQLEALYAKFLQGRGILNGRHFFRMMAFETFLRRFESHVAGLHAAD